MHHATSPQSCAASHCRDATKHQKTTQPKTPPVCRYHESPTSNIPFAGTFPTPPLPPKKQQIDKNRTKRATKIKHKKENKQTNQGTKNQQTKEQTNKRKKRNEAQPLRPRAPSAWAAKPPTTASPFLAVMFLLVKNKHNKRKTIAVKQTSYINKNRCITCIKMDISQNVRTYVTTSSDTYVYYISLYILSHILVETHTCTSPSTISTSQAAVMYLHILV